MNEFKIKTDETLRETIEHGSSSYPFSFYLENIWDFDFHRIDWHWHYELEFVYVASGTAICLIGTDSFTLHEGYGLFINSGILHRFETNGNTIIPNIVFAPEFLSPENGRIYQKYILPVIQSDCAYQIFDPETGWQRDVIKYLKGVFLLQGENISDELGTLHLLTGLWDTLYSNLNTDIFLHGTKHIKPQQAKLQNMMQFIHDNYSKELTLRDIADSVMISNSSAINIFKTYINMPPVTYLIEHRLKIAAALLCNTEDTVTQIAEKAGFANTGYFCRKFKQYYKTTPNTYRRTKLGQL